MTAINIRSTFTIVSTVIAIAIVGSVLIMEQSTSVTTPSVAAIAKSAASAPVRTPITAAQLNAMRWQELGNIVSELTANPNEIKRVSIILEQTESPVSLYLRALLFLAENEPQSALAVFERIDLGAMPADFLYAPHRLHRSLKPDAPDHYLERLQQAVKENKTSALIRARILAGDGNLELALSSYLQSDPATWAQYDLQLFRNIGSYQGLSIDLARMITGAISSGRVKKDLEPKLKHIARQPGNQSELSAFEQRIKHAIKHGTPEGQIALASARKLLRDRKIFLNRKYDQLIGLYNAAEPIKLATETLLLLFLSAVDLKQQQQAEVWGQELKRRHADLEVRDWVNSMMASL